MDNRAESDENARSEASGEAREIGALEALWSFFGSMKTAIVLLLLLAAASVVGTVIEQNAPPEAYGQSRYAVLRSLGLTDVYHSSWYVLLLTLIGMNLTVCSIKRCGVAWRRTFQSRVSAKPAQIAKMQRSETFSLAGPVDEAAGKLMTALRSSSYRIAQERESDGISLHATKGRLGIWGPYLTHLSMLVIFAGAILGNRLGFNGYTTITEGGYTETCYLQGTGERKDLGFRVALRKFTVDHDGNHNPTGYKSDLGLYNGGELVVEKVIDVNQPLTYKGVSFFQSDYGLDGFVVKVTAPNGETARLVFRIETRDWPDGKQYLISGGMWRQVEIGSKKLAVFAHDFAPDYVGGSEVNASFLPINPAAQIMVSDRFPEYEGRGAWSNLGWLVLSKSAEYKGFTVTMEDVVDYTGLQVVRNPALPVVYSGFGLMLVGVFVSFYVAHRMIRVRVAPSEKGVTVTVGGMSRAGPSAFDGDFARLREALT